MSRRVAVLAVVALIAASLITVGASPASSVPLVPAPSSMAALGDSVSRGFATGSGACTTFAPCPEYSWSTGTAVNSHYQRLLALNPALAGRATNAAVPGSTMSALASQVGTIAVSQPDYVTVLLGGGDICFAATTAAQFGAQFRAGMDALFAASPDSRVLVASIFNLESMRTAMLAGNPSFVWSFCGVFFNAAPGDRALLMDRLVSYNQVLEAECATYANCLFDGYALFDHVWSPTEVSTIDGVHPSGPGEEMIAQVLFDAGYQWDSPDDVVQFPGLVTDSVGAPIVGANGVACVGSFTPSGCSTGSLITGEQTGPGTFTLALEPGTYQIAAVITPTPGQPSLRSPAAPVTIPGPFDTGIQIIFAGPLTGLVTDPDGVVEGATIAVNQGGGFVDVATTGPDGRYESPPLPHSLYQVRATPPGGTAVDAVTVPGVSVSSGAPVVVDFDLGDVGPEPSGTVDVTIGEPPPGSYYFGFCADPGVPQLGSTTCSDGRPVLALASLAGGGTTSVGLPVGLYHAALTPSTLNALSPIGDVTVASGATTSCTFTMAAGPACTGEPADDDGVADEVEDAAPPPSSCPACLVGDGNGDGTPDSEQGNVTSLPAAVGGGYVTVVVPAATALTEVSTIDPASLPAPPPEVLSFPGGLVGFTVEGVDLGETVAVDVIFHGAGAPDAYYKFHNGAWLDFSSDADIVGGIATLTLTDGAVGDADGIVNGRIVDPGGVAVTASAPPADVIVDEGDTGKTTVDLTVTVATRTIPKQKVGVDWCTAADTATADVDYDQKCAHIDLTKSEASQTIKVKVRSDLLAEADEDFLVHLAATGGTLERDTIRVRIVDNDVAVDDEVDVGEGDHGSMQVKLTVVPESRTTPNTPIVVSWCTEDGSATAPSDYKERCKQFTMGPRAKKHTIQVAVRGDSDDEPDEDFGVSLTATGGTIVHGHYTVNIVDDD